MTKRDWLDLADAWNRTGLDLIKSAKLFSNDEPVYAALFGQFKLAQFMAKHLMDIAESKSDED